MDGLVYTVDAPMAAAVVSIEVKPGERLLAHSVVGTLEAMKMLHPVLAAAGGEVLEVLVETRDAVQKGQPLVRIRADASLVAALAESDATASASRADLVEVHARLARTLDAARMQAAAKRHASGYRSARENLHDLVDADSFLEYGQLAVAAQRNRRDYRELQAETAADGVITGTATINAPIFGADAARVAVAVYDYSVLAGTQGFFHHRKLDRIFETARRERLPVVMYTEGGGGRPGDTDVTTQIAGLDVPSFARWAALSGKVPRIAVNNGYCFAGNAALFGCADITIATRSSWIGMAGPAMIEGGGLGVFKPTEIGPAAEQSKNGVIDLLAADERDATALAKQVLGYFQGTTGTWQTPDQTGLRDSVPIDRRFPYSVRAVIDLLADCGTWLELRAEYARGIVTGFMRIEGRAIGVIANDCRVLGGAIDAAAATKAARFLQLCDAFALPVLSLVDTPGFMVGPQSEQDAAVRRMSSLFVVGATISVPLVAIFLRKAYGLGAMAMCGGGFACPVYAAAWPSGEFGGMGLEGAVRLGYRKELAAIADAAERQALFERLVARMVEAGKATEAAAHLEIDAVIDPAETRTVICRALEATGPILPPAGQRRNFIDTW